MALWLSGSLPAMYHAENIGPLVESEREQRERAREREREKGKKRAPISSGRARESAAVSGDKSSVCYTRSRGERKVDDSFGGRERACRV